MSKVRSKDTKPERKVRKLVYGLGYRYRLNDKRLPGGPDLTFFKLRKVIFVHGCFWHGHDCLAGRNVPKSNLIFWNAKFKRNKERDAENQGKIKSMGFNYLIIWECELKDIGSVQNKILEFLSGER